MRTLATALLASIALVAMVLPTAGGASPGPGPDVPAVQFGMDAGGISAQTAAGATPDYGTFWIGPWTLSSGWGGPDAQLASMKAAGVTPAIHFYYWGDDISPSCVENGCWSDLHDAQKTRAGWEQLGKQLTDHLTAKMGGEPVVVFLESEFNKGGISTYEPFDGYMATMATKIHAGYPNAIVVLGFGAWDSGNWYRFDQAAAASDMVGVQAMRGSTKDSATHYNSIYEGTLASVQKLDGLFGKPIMLTDVALSSYPEPSYLGMQADNLAELFANLPTLKANGVEAIIYRSWKDSPNMDLANYYGQAERHWGLAWAGNGTQKAAGKVWVAGVQAEREASANHAPLASFTASAAGLGATLDARGSSDPDGDALSYAWRLGDGATASGATATHAYASAGTYTVTLTVSDGDKSDSATRTLTVAQPNRAPVAGFSAATSQLTASVDAGASSDADGDALTYAWTFGDGSSAAGKTASRTYTAAGTYTVTLTVSDGKATATASKAVTVTKPAPAPTPFSATVAPKGNEWWVEAKVTSDRPVAKVEAKAGSGAWTALDKKDWGAYAKSFKVPKGTMVQFRVTAADGAVASTSGQAWLVDMASKTATGTLASPTVSTTTTTTAAPTSTSASSFKATFTPRSVGNDWWVESAVSANQPVSKVEAKVNGGAWVVLPKQDWGNYAKSINAPNGASVVFKATSSTGATYSSVAYTWT